MGPFEAERLGLNDSVCLSQLLRRALVAFLPP